MTMHATALQEPDPWPILTDDVHAWQQGDDRVSVAVLSPRTLGVVLVGSMSADALDVVEPCLDDFLHRTPDGAHMFWDAELMKDHDAAFRDGILRVMREHRDRWSTVHVLYRSLLVGVSVSAGNLFLGGSVVPHRRRASFRAAVEQALAAP